MRNLRKPAPRPNLNLKSLPVLALAGRAVLTFRNLETGTHMTVKLKQWRDRQDRKIKLPIYSVEISMLGDRWNGYVKAGTLRTDSWTVTPGRGVSLDSRTGRALTWLTAAIQNPERIRGRVGLFHEGRCCECGLPLTHPESINTGLGPVCLGRVQARMIAAGGKVQIAELFETLEPTPAG